MNMPPTYDPELPFFYELRKTLVAQAERDVAAERRREAWRRWYQAVPVRRFTRRATVLTSLLVVIAATAWGASTIVQGPRAPVPGTGVAPVTRTLLRTGGDFGSDHWSLRVWMAGPQICDELSVGLAENSTCQAVPAAGQVRSLTVESPQNRYVFGVTGPRPRGVAVRLDSRSRQVSTHGLTHSRERWFVVGFVRPAGNATPPAHVTALLRQHS